jgi:hypothetical protein
MLQLAVTAAVVGPLLRMPKYVKLDDDDDDEDTGTRYVPAELGVVTRVAYREFDGAVPLCTPASV